MKAQSITHPKICGWRSYKTLVGWTLVEFSQFGSLGRSKDALTGEWLGGFSLPF